MNMMIYDRDKCCESASCSRPKFKRILKSIFIVGFIVGCLLGVLAECVFSTNFTLQEETLLYIRPGETPSDIQHKLKEECGAGQMIGWKTLCFFCDYEPKTGAYLIKPGATTLEVFRHLKHGWQTPVRYTLPAVRTLNRLAASIAQHLMLDSATVAQSLSDSARLAEWGYTTETIPALFLPNTYELYWDISLDDFLQRMVKENDNFWQQNDRLQRAQQQGLSPVEVATLASIVDEETAYNPEKPRIAGLYLNRLHKGMFLQADPTVKFAVNDPALRRIRKGHLQTNSPYNTYLNKGLPPGPIRIASIQGIDAVLQAEHHSFLYMCAKEDFSGAHNFATTFSEHQRNARRYARALNARGIQ